MPDTNTNPIPIPVVDPDPTPYWYASKKFWSAILTAVVSGVVTIVMKHFGSTGREILEVTLPIVGIMSSYILGQSAVDAKVYSAIVQNTTPTISSSSDQPIK